MPRKNRKSTFLKILALSSILGFVVTIVSSVYSLLNKEDPTLLGFTPGQISLNITLIFLGLALFSLSNVRSFFTFPKGGYTAQEILMTVGVIVGGFAIGTGLFSFFVFSEFANIVVNILKAGLSFIAIIIVGMQVLSKD